MSSYGRKPITEERVNKCNDSYGFDSDLIALLKETRIELQGKYNAVYLSKVL